MSKLQVFKKYPSIFWISNIIELFERYAWYGFYMGFGLFLVGSKETGAMGFSPVEKGAIMGTGSMLLYFLPIITGAIADKIGYKKVLFLAFLIYMSGFYMIQQFHSFEMVFVSFIWICVGGAFFKPIISAMISKTTNEETASIGFGIFYMMVNIGGFIGPTVVEAEVKANADYMAQNLKEFGWGYIIVDIRWYVDNDKAHGYNETDPVYNLDEYGRLLPSVERFPSAEGGKGFKPLADYIHSKGLKFGIHIMRGIPVEAVKRNTPILGSKAKAQDIYSTELQCRWLRDMYTVVAEKDGAQEYYTSLFELYASWEVDYVKIDDLSIPYHAKEIEMIRKAIDNSGRQIVLSTSPGETPIEHAEPWEISASAMSG